jgi:hypothetical protein
MTMKVKAKGALRPRLQLQISLGMILKSQRFLQLRQALSSLEVSNIRPLIKIAADPMRYEVIEQAPNRDINPGKFAMFFVGQVAKMGMR